METVPPAGAAVPAGVRQPSGNSSGSCGSMKDSNRSNSPRKGVGVEVQHYTTAEELAALLDVTTLNGGNHHNSCYTNDVHNNHMKNSCSAPATSNSTAPQESAAAKSAAHNLHPQSTAPCLPAAAIETKNVAEQQQQQQQSLMSHDAGSTTIAAGTETSVTTGTPGAASAAAAQEGRTNSPPPYPTMPFSVDGITYIAYESELQMPAMMELFQKDLSEPYSIYTYRYFIHNWPKLCFLAMDGDKCVGAIVCKLDAHKKRDAAVTADAVAGGQQGGHGQIRVQMRGYIAMLAVEAEYRKRKIASNLVLTAIRAMVANRADEVVLETEITNQPALRLYENLGFNDAGGGRLLLSDSCVAKLRRTADPGEMLRVTVEGGGCSGFQYKLSLDKEVKGDDLVFERNGAKVVCDKMSLGFIEGSTVDYEEELIRSGFRILDNPLADKKCSCGSSFTPKIEL